MIAENVSAKSSSQSSDFEKSNPKQSATTGDDKFRMNWPLFWGFMAKFMTYVGIRFPYSFSVYLEERLAISSLQYSWIASATEFPGIFTPAFGPIAEIYGSLNPMFVSILLFLVANVLSAVVLDYKFWPFFFARLLFGFGSCIFEPMIQSIIVQMSSYETVGRNTGILEWSWAVSSLIGVPLIGFLLDQLSFALEWIFILQVIPFFVLGAVCFRVFRVLKETKPGTTSTQSTRDVLDLTADPKCSINSAQKVAATPPSPSVFQNMFTIIIETAASIKAVALHRVARASCLWIILFPIGSNMLSITYPQWFVDEGFISSVSSLGLIGIFIGLGELTGSGSTSLLSDRVSRRTLLVISSFITSFTYLLLPFLASFGFEYGILGLYLHFANWEFGTVTGIGFSSVVYAEKTEVTISCFLACLFTGRVTGAVLGAMFFSAGGMSLVVSVATALSLTATVLLFWQTMGFEEEDGSEDEDSDLELELDLESSSLDQGQREDGEEEEKERAQEEVEEEEGKIKNAPTIVPAPSAKTTAILSGPSTKATAKPSPTHTFQNPVTLHEVEVGEAIPVVSPVASPLPGSAKTPCPAEDVVRTVRKSTEHSSKPGPKPKSKPKDLKPLTKATALKKKDDDYAPRKKAELTLAPTSTTSSKGVADGKRNLPASKLKCTNSFSSKHRQGGVGGGWSQC
eukprot:GCRY01003088.1.p1 GENE.GCRY01003088.1~~GCRY01003088.1.p1  ORF type:complete len:684 (-),score=88.82 GCRY01003088.1:7-2058(-)